MEDLKMKYTVDIDRSIDALAHCIQKVNNEIEDIWDWRISINASGIDYGIYFNFDLERKELEISNAPSYGYDDSLGLDEIIEEINGNEEEEDEKD